ncbi:MAG: helix-turn-helix transcriptional regulator [Clostridia bacterium]|nr:helix-turn-helix transcriptional regulator [Clostridia bacterium]
MNEKWEKVTITEIALALHVPEKGGKAVHKNRSFHGLVLNEEGGIKDYCFSDGRVMHTEGGDLFYLPKGSSYYVKTIQSGRCYAINFDAEIDDKPFCCKLKSNESLKKAFREACDAWRMQDPSSRIAAMRALYDGIYRMQKEQQKAYIPSDRLGLIEPAVEAIHQQFADRTLTVASLAKKCDMSEVYFRKLFLHRFGISPKEYLLQKRMEYASQLLALGEFGVSEVAELCGYGEPCYFSRAFKKRFGTSPNNYQ